MLVVQAVRVYVFVKEMLISDTWTLPEQKTL